jgi:hypothetical protein
MARMTQLRHRPIWAIKQPFAGFEARTAGQLPIAIDAAARAGTASLLALEDPMLLGARQQILDLVARARLPAIYGFREFAQATAKALGIDIPAEVTSTR